MTAEVAGAHRALPAGVRRDRRLGPEGTGFFGLMRTFDRSRVTLAASATGLARAALEYAVGYARERVQFGRRSPTSRADHLPRPHADVRAYCGASRGHGASASHAAAARSASASSNRRAVI